ncbi:MAG: hypothetical protein ACLQIB_08345 [Isosphaeraceae bacterium]
MATNPAKERYIQRIRSESAFPAFRSLIKPLIWRGPPKKPTSVLLEFGFAEEGVVIPRVARWLDSAPPRVLCLHDVGWELLRDALIGSGARPNKAIQRTALRGAADLGR